MSDSALCICGHPWSVHSSLGPACDKCDCVRFAAAVEPLAEEAAIAKARLCSTPDCGKIATVWYDWPGQLGVKQCVIHGAAARRIAKALGFDLCLNPIASEAQELTLQLAGIAT